MHFLRNLLAQVPKSAKSMVAAMVRMVFLQPSPQRARDHLRDVAKTLGERWPKAAELLIAAQDEILACLAFPQTHGRQIYSTNPLERLMKEIKRRSDVVGIFPNRDSVLPDRRGAHRTGL